jgi:hypothetical protein
VFGGVVRLPIPDPEEDAAWCSERRFEDVDAWLRLECPTVEWLWKRREERVVLPPWRPAVVDLEDLKRRIEVWHREVYLPGTRGRKEGPR